MATLADPAALAQLVERLRRLTPAQTRAWGTMSPQQMASHLGDASAAVLKQREFSATPRKPNPLRRLLVLYVLSRLPRGVRSGADPAAKQLDPGAFASDVERAVALLNQLAAAPPESLAQRHPVFGAMSRKNWMRWAYMHTDHHLRQFGL